MAGVARGKLDKQSDKYSPIPIARLRSDGKGRQQIIIKPIKTKQKPQPTQKSINIKKKEEHYDYYEGSGG